MSASVPHISGHISGSVPPKVDLYQSAVSGPSSVPSASPTLSAASSPTISSAIPANPLKRKAKKRKKRLTDDDFIMADLADWESARASKPSLPVSPSLADTERPISRAGSTASAQAEPQTPRDSQAVFPLASSSSSAPTLNGSSSLRASSVIHSETENPKDSSDVPAVSAPVLVTATPTVAQATVCDSSVPGESETKSNTPAPVVTPGVESAQAVPPAEFMASKPAPSTTSPEADLRRQTSSPGSPRTGRKKRPSQEFRFIPESSSSPTSLPIKRKRRSPSLVVFRLDSQVRAKGVLTPPTDGSMPDTADAKRVVEQKRQDSPPKPSDADIIANGKSEAKNESVHSNASPIPEDASGTTQEQAARHESQPVPVAAAKETSTQASGSVTTPASDRLSEDVEMVDQLQESDTDKAEPSSEPMDVDGGNKAEDFVARAADSPMMDVEAEPSVVKKCSDAAAFEQLRPSLVDEPRVSVATSEAPASAGLGHTQPGTVVKAHTGDIGMPEDAQPPTGISPSTMALTSTSAESPPPPTFEGVMQELAEKKGMSDTIVSKIVGAMSEEPRAAVSEASALSVRPHDLV